MKDLEREIGERDLESWKLQGLMYLARIDKETRIYSAFGVFTRLVYLNVRYSVHLPSLSIYQTGLSECEIFCSSYSSEKKIDLFEEGFQETWRERFYVCGSYEQ